MISRELFDNCGVNYDILAKMISVIIRKLTNKRGYREFRDELYSEAWMIILDLLPEYQSEENVKLTTFLWPQIYWRLHRYLHSLEVEGERKEETDLTLFSTESTDDDSIFESNPYHNAPDIVYEKQENVAVWEKIREKHADICRIFVTSTHNATSAQRSCLSKRRKKAFPILQQSYQLIV